MVLDTKVLFSSISIKIIKDINTIMLSEYFFIIDYMIKYNKKEMRWDKWRDLLKRIINLY